MKTKLLSVIFFFITTISIGQTWQWVKSAGGIGSDKANDMAIDNNGNSYIGGYYNTGQPAVYTATFGTIVPPTLSSSWGKEGFIAKVDRNGNFQWVNSVLSGWDERVLGVCVDKANGFVYATGTFWDWGGTNVASLNNATTLGVCNISTSTSGGTDNIFVAKMDLNGTCQWMIGLDGANGDDHGYDVATDNQGNVYLTGYISSEYGLNPVGFGLDTVVAPLGDSLSFVAKMLPSGVFQWVRTFGNCDGERDNRLTVDNFNNVYVTGGFHGTKAFGTTTLSSINNGLDVFVIKYDQFGNFLWSQQAGGILDDRANGIAFDDASQKIYISGEFRDYAYFGTDTVNNNGGPGGRDIFVAKMNCSNGNWNWVKKAGSKSGGERGDQICINNKGNIFVTGQFADTAKFGPIIQLISIPSATADIFVAAIDSMGKWQWALKGGTITEDRGNGIACDDSCNVYACGYYEGTASFGSFSLPQYGKKDFYVAKITNTCFIYVLNFDELFAHESAAFLFPNPATDAIEIKLNYEGLNIDDVKVIFLDVLGRNVNIARQTNTNNLIFDISSLSQGVYSVNLIYEGKTKVVKFVKQ